MKKFACLLLSVVSISAYAQTTPSAEDITRSVADNIIATTSFKFINNKTKKTFESTKGKDTSVSVRAENKFNRWQYVNGVLTIGMVQLANATKDSKYSDYSKKNFNFIFNNINYFKEQFDAGTTSLNTAL